MKYINKYSVSTVLVILTLSILGYTVDVFPDKIEVSMPSTECGTALLRVTKDDFTLKCGYRIAFQADTVIDYYKTYGPDEWVRNSRYVGRAKKDIQLELFEYEDSFDIIRTTRYRKGRQYVQDGVLREIYTFTQDKVKITYDYEVNNKAKHRISMRIKKQYNSYLDVADPSGNTAIQKGNIVSYEGYGNLLIDPSVNLNSPADRSNAFNEGDTVSFTCNGTQNNESELKNISFMWNVIDEDDFHINETTTITGNTSVTFTKVILHPNSSTFPGYFNWSCRVCNGSGIPTSSNCTIAETRIVDPRYKPEPVSIFSPNTTSLNLLNGSILAWGGFGFYGGLIHTNGTDFWNSTVYINWTYPGMRDNSTDIIYTLSYFGTTNASRRFVDLNYSTDNDSIHGLWNVSALPVDLYFVVLSACNALNETLCVNDTLDTPVDIFDYGVNITTGETKIRFSPQPSITKGAALGQTATKGIIEVDWLGNRAPDGQINLSINLTAADACMTIYALDSNTPASALELTNQTYTTSMNSTSTDPDYIWLWADKVSCGTTTLDFSLDLDLFFGGLLTGGT